MTKISVTYLNKGFIFQGVGHTCHKEKGEDIVCAAVSALCISLFERLEQLANEGRATIIRCHMVSGDIYISVKIPEENSRCEPAWEALETVCAGLRRIEDMYPENMSVEE